MKINENKIVLAVFKYAKFQLNISKIMPPRPEEHRDMR